MQANTPEHVQQAYTKAAEMLFANEEIRLGPWTSYSLVHDPRHMCFVLSRYKFCAKMLQGRQRVMEIGVGDGFGLPILAQAVGHVYAVDWDKRLLESNAARLGHLRNVTYVHADFNHQAPDLKVDAICTIDVIEHIDPAGEDRFIGNMIRCLGPAGVLITGTPNLTAAEYASPPSKAAHINLKSHESLRQLMERYFENVFMFGMNDEVVHTGFGPMCHYLWSLAVGVRPAR
ncbi:MAG: class I SAM-dependent methyltransferase [Gemmataceae bacterium]|nr:class I SAM-dependent methyltransferase [Gemmataceae bacterium]